MCKQLCFYPFKNITEKLVLHKLYVKYKCIFKYRYKQDLALNNLQSLIHPKTQQKSKNIYICIYISDLHKEIGQNEFAQSAGAVEYPDCTSAEG